MNVPEKIAKYGLHPRGVIQVGSHHGEEIPVWEGLGIPHVHFEPIHSNCEKLLELHPGAKVFPVALGARAHHAVMFTEMVNGGQSCSLLAPKKHLEILPWIVFNGTETVSVATLDSMPLDFPLYNFIYMDAQGYELEVLNGAGDTLAGIDFIFTEVNRDEVFSGCALVEELDAFLLSYGFRRVETEWHGGDFGDALYVKHHDSTA